jgi:hypothetical protein
MGKRISFRKSNKFIGSLEEFDTVEQGDTVILSGDLVFSTLNKKTNPGELFLLQSPRNTSLLSVGQKKNPLFIWVRKEVFEIAKEIGKLRLVLAHDYYLRAGLLKNQKTIFCCGYSSPTGMNLEIFIFEKRSLISLEEYNLPPMKSIRFSTDLSERLKKLGQENEGTVIEWHAPLPDIPELLSRYKINKISSWSFLLPIPRSAEDHTSKDSKGFWMLFMIISFLMIGVYLSVLFWGWRGYNERITEYKQEISGYEQEFDKGSNNLKELETKKFFLNQTLPYQGRVEFVAKALSSLASTPGAVVQEFEILMDPEDNTNSGRNRNEEKFGFKVLIHVPKRPNLNALEQVEPILQGIANKLGVEARMIEYHNVTLPGYLNSERQAYTIIGSHVD